MAALITGTSFGISGPGKHGSSGLQVASVGDSDIARCDTQVADTPKRLVPTTANAVDTNIFGGDPAGPSPASATPTPKVYTNVMKTLWDATPSDTSYLGAIPGVIGFDAGTASNPSVHATATWAKSADTASATPVSMSATTSDSGQTWSAPTTTSGDIPSFSVPLRDGRVLAVGFKATKFDPGSATMPGSITDSTGDPGTSSPATVTYEGFLGGDGGPFQYFRTAGNPIQRADGSVLVPIYGPDTAATSHSIVAFGIATPPPAGGDWVFRPLRPDMSQPISATNAVTKIGTDAPTLNFSETALLERPDNSIIAIIRNLVNNESSGSNTLAWTASTDGGVTWLPRTDLKGTLEGWGSTDSTQVAGLAGGIMPGVNPHLELLTNGLIVLSAGRPDNWIAASATGNATGWFGWYTYRNCPTTVVPPSTNYNGNDPDEWRYGSSGNTSILAVGSDRIMQYGDNCHNYYWGCVRTNATTNAALSVQSPYTVDLTSRIWQRRIDIVTPNVGKLDLAGMLDSGAMTVDTNMTFSSSAHPRTGYQAAFDGSRRYWSSAVSSGADGYMTLDLGKAYTLNRIGLSLRPQLPESATVEVSTDNTNWSTVTTRTNAVTRALTYTDITPVSARYVKVTVPSAGGCDDGLASTCAFLNELELYSTVDGFENDPWGNLPRGALASPAPSMVWITSDTSGGSHQALRLSDSSTSLQAKVSFASAASASKTLAFRVNPVAWASGANGGFIFTLNSGTSAAVQIAIFKDGTLHAYNGSAYTSVAVDPIPIGSWATVTLTRTSTGTTLRVGSGPTATVAPAASASTVDGYTFASSGSSPSGDQVLIDDVDFH
jgi:hypothetical protein